MMSKILGEIRQKSALPWIAAGLVLGIVIGHFLGWQVWPVSWYDMDPSDLRLEHQMSHVLMAADSFALTGAFLQVTGY